MNTPNLAFGSFLELEYPFSWPSHTVQIERSLVRSFGMPDFSSVWWMSAPESR